MRSTNRKRQSADGPARLQKADAGPRGRTRRAVKAAVLDEDVTAPKQAEEALRASEERLRALVTNAPVVLFSVDSQGVLTFVEGRDVETLRARRGPMARLARRCSPPDSG